MGYPKIDTLYNRNPNTFKVIEEDFRREEFTLINKWFVTEKIDGTNVCVHLHDGYVTYEGHHDKSQMQPNVLKFMHSVLDPDVVADAFEYGSNIRIYGEAYGKGVQKMGENYRKDISFRIFDVSSFRGNREVFFPWYGKESVTQVASSLRLKTVPVIGSGLSLEEAVSRVRSFSIVAEEENMFPAQAEGIVARTEPGLLDSSGNRVVWKLKLKDFS